MSISQAGAGTALLAANNAFVGNQSITGSLAVSSTISAADPTANSHVVTKSYFLANQSAFDPTADQTISGNYVFTKVLRGSTDIVARSGGSKQVTIGGSTGLAGITFGVAEDCDLYRVASQSLRTGSAIRTNGSAGFFGKDTTPDSSLFLQVKADGDANAGFAVLADGTHQWGAAGATALDTTLYRSSANTLKTDDTFVAVDGVTTKVKAGVPVDGDFASTPADGTLVVDTTNSRLYARIGGTWKLTALV